MSTDAFKSTPVAIWLTSVEAEVARELTICNACRYCEGFCAVFPAMTRRLEFGKFDVDYLANLCHNCGACLHACQYAPPHEFAVNLPRAMAQVRVQTYADYAWPHAFGRVYKRSGLVVALALASMLALFLVLAAAMNGTLWQAPPANGFYSVFPHNLMVAMFAPVFIYAITALGMGGLRFWREAPPGRASGDAVAGATHDALTLRYLGGGHGEGCNEGSDRFTLARRHFHHATFYGFMLCFAATCTATLYHYAFGWEAPYAYTSLPKLLGIVGGVLLTLGACGLLALNLKRHPDHGDIEQRPMDRGFIALLLIAAAGGLALTVLRDTAALPTLLAIHLGSVMALFLTMPYGKFAHAVYRGVALLKWNVEKRLPNPVTAGE